MRRSIAVLVLFVLLLGAASSMADESRDVPATVWYQGFLADVTTGEPIEGTVDIIARLYTTPVGGTALWGPENHIGVPVAEGWFNIELGSVTPLPNFYGSSYYLDLRVEGEVLSSRMKLASVPAALHAASADTSFTGGGGGAMLWTEAGPDIYRATGEVGIGTAPDDELHVKSDQNGITGITIENTDTGSASAERLSFVNEDGSVAGIALYDDDHGAYAGRMAVFNNRPNGTLWLRAGATAVFIDTTGFVGVGTTSPEAKLDVSGAVNVDGFSMVGGASDGYVLTSDGSGVGMWEELPASDDGDWTVDGDDVYPAVSGNVGIGTAAPAYPLHVVTSGSEDIVFQATTDPGSVEFIGLTNGGANDDLKMSKHGPTASGSTAGVALAGLGRISSGNQATGLMLQAKGDTPMHFAAGDTVRMRIDPEGVVNIIDVLHLEPTGAIPSSPTNGDMIVYDDGGSQGLYIYINDFWELLVGTVKSDINEPAEAVQP